MLDLRGENNVGIVFIWKVWTPIMWSCKKRPILPSPHPLEGSQVSNWDGQNWCHIYVQNVSVAARYHQINCVRHQDINQKLCQTKSFGSACNTSMIFQGQIHHFWKFRVCAYPKMRTMLSDTGDISHQGLTSRFQMFQGRLWDVNSNPDFESVVYPIRKQLSDFNLLTSMWRCYVCGVKL